MRCGWGSTTNRAAPPATPLPNCQRTDSRPFGDQERCDRESRTSPSRLTPPPSGHARPRTIRVATRKPRCPHSAPMLDPRRRTIPTSSGITAVPHRISSSKTGPATVRSVPRTVATSSVAGRLRGLASKLLMTNVAMPGHSPPLDGADASTPGRAPRSPRFPSCLPPHLI